MSLAEVESLQARAYAESTARSRRRAVLAFVRFCAFTQLPFFPAPTDTLCRYVAYLSHHRVKASSISSYMSHIGTFHKLKGYEDPTKNFALSTTVRGVARTYGSPTNSKSPLTPVELKRIRATLDWTSSLHRTFWAVLVVGFWSYLRSSNLVQKTKGNFDNLRHVSPDNMSLTEEGILISLQRTKTIQFNERALHIPLVPMSGNFLCPLQALRDMWELCPAQCGTSLFTSRSPSGSFSPLVHSHLNKREYSFRDLVTQPLSNPALVIKRHCTLAGLPAKSFSGHSLRKGGATCALLAGVSETMVKLQGDWVSDAYRRYISFSLAQKVAVPRQVESAMLENEFWNRCATLSSTTAASLYQ